MNIKFDIKMRNKFYIIKLVFYSLIIILCLAFNVNAQIPSSVDTLKIVSVSGEPGEAITVSVYLANTFPVAGVSARLVFDQEYFNTGAIQLTERTSMANIFTVDTTQAGVIHLGAAYLFPRVEYITIGQGNIFDIEFTIDSAAAPGVYPMELRNSGFNTYENHLSDTTGLQLVIPVLVDGAVTVTNQSAIEPGNLLPDNYEFIRNYPNPFNNTTNISYGIKAGGRGRIEIYNLLGEKVKTFDLGTVSPGHYNTVWDGRSDDGKEVSSGIYSYALYLNQLSVSTNKMILLK